MKSILVGILIVQFLYVYAQNIFGAGSISTHLSESYLTLSPNGKELFFVRSDSFYNASQKIIYYSELKGLNWTEPTVAPFSGKYSDTSPFITYDNKWVYFSSNRPVSGKKGTDSDLWRVARLEDGSWGNPEHLGFLINSFSSEYSPSLDLEGNLYFGSTRNKAKWGNIFFCRKNGMNFSDPIELPYPINTEDGEWGSCVSPNGDFIVFESNGREENLTYDGDLYIAWKEHNLWKGYKHLPFNSKKSDLSPRIFQDSTGAYHLFFASNRNPNNIDSDDVDIYSVLLRISELK